MGGGGEGRGGVIHQWAPGGGVLEALPSLQPFPNVLPVRGLQDGLQDGAQQSTAAGKAQAVAGHGLPRPPAGIGVWGGLEEEDLDLKAEPYLGRKGEENRKREGVMSS